MRNINPNLPKSGQILLPHQQFDVVTQDIIHRFPEDVLQLIMNRTDIEYLDHIETDFAIVEKREMDSLIKVLLNKELVLIHCEFQVGDSTVKDMVRRNVGYLGRCYEKYGLPIFSHVVYLRPNAGLKDPGGYRQDVAGYNFIVEYKVVRLIEIDGQSILELQQPGLMPFLPLMKPPTGLNPIQWMHRCVETTKSMPFDSPTRSNLLVGMWIMDGIVNERQPIANLFQEDIMQESTVYQNIIRKGRVEGFEQGIKRGIEQGLEQGLEQGERKNTIEGILELLDIRFQDSTTETLETTIEGIDDLTRLKQLRRAAAQVQTLAAFIRTLENGDESV